MTKAAILRRAWEHRFPNLDDSWTHWWMEGDGQFLDLLARDKLSKALDIVQEN